MSSINAGKQQASFNWYTGISADTIKNVIISSPSTEAMESIIPSSYNNIHGADLLPSNVDQLRSIDTSYVSIPISSNAHNTPLPELPSTSHSLLEHVQTQDFIPDVDRVELSRSPKEPSRIRRSPLAVAGPHLAYKHPHPVEEAYTQQFGELPLKRVRIDERSELSSELWDYNTFAGSDRIDFQFARQSSSDATIAMEEAEREDRMRRRANPVLVGKFFKIQKEFMSRLNKPIMISSVAPLARGLSDSMSTIKDVILEKGHNIIDASKDAITHLNPHPLRSTLDSITADAQQINNFRPLSLGGDKIEFVWPRVPAYIKDAEELARSERTSQGVPPILFGKWKSLNRELKSKWGSSGFALTKIAMPKKSLMDNAGSLVGKASHAIEEAVHYTTGMMENLGLKAPASAHDAEWVTLQQEKERARRINEESLLSPGFENRKFRVEKQLLRTVNALKSKSEL